MRKSPTLRALSAIGSLRAVEQAHARAQLAKAHQDLAAASNSLLGAEATLQLSIADWEETARTGAPIFAHTHGQRLAHISACSHEVSERDKDERLAQAASETAGTRLGDANAAHKAIIELIKHAQRKAGRKRARVSEVRSGEMRLARPRSGAPCS